jgi:hypothetical protein
MATPWPIPVDPNDSRSNKILTMAFGVRQFAGFSKRPHSSANTSGFDPAVKSTEMAPGRRISTSFMGCPGFIKGSAQAARMFRPADDKEPARRRPPQETRRKSISLSPKARAASLTESVRGVTRLMRVITGSFGADDNGAGSGRAFSPRRPRTRRSFSRDKCNCNFSTARSMAAYRSPGHLAGPKVVVPLGVNHHLGNVPMLLHA